MATIADALVDEAETPSERDLALFIGRRAAPFLRTYWRGGGPLSGPFLLRSFALSWSWPAFLIPVPWLLYRKMYAIAFGYVAVIVLLGLSAPGAATSTGAAFSILMGLIGKGLYLQHALRRLRRADTRGLTGAQRDDYLQRAGGVSMAAATYGTLFVLSIIALAIVSSAALGL